MVVCLCYAELVFLVGNSEQVVRCCRRDSVDVRLLSVLQLYRLERYDECLAVYRDLVRNSQDDYDEERKTNLSAVVAAQSNWEKVVPVSAFPRPWCAAPRCPATSRPGV